jgi:beta-lactamase regulating signal transducer with metallopeptidase domain
MTETGTWLSAGIVLPLGWTLIHSLWQDFAIALLARFLMALSRRPSTRYLVGVSALVLMVAASVATFLAFHTAPTAVLPARGFAAGFLPSTAPIRQAAVLSVTGSHWPAPRIMSLLVTAWLFGVALFSLRLACGFLLLEHRRRWHSRPPAGHFLTLCREVQDRLGLARAVGYLECDWLHAPAVVGWLRPIVLLPVTALIGLSEDQLRAVIAHELAHIRRLDCVANFLQALVEALLFYHPAVWWLGRRIRTEREHCCDEIAISLYDNRLEYARALGLMGEWRSAPALAMAANRGPLSERILCVLGREVAIYKPQPLAFSAGLLFLMAVLTAGRVMPAGVLHMPAFRAVPAAPVLSRNISPTGTIRAPVASPVIENGKMAMERRREEMREQWRLERAYHIHADPLPGVTVAAFSVAQPQIALAPIVVDQPAPQTGPVSAVAPAGDDASLRDQPAGFGGRDDVVCREPQRLQGSQALGPKVCRKNADWHELWIRGETLSADGKSVLEPTAAEMVDGIPDGAGVPDQVVCARPQHQSTSRLLTPKQCFRNAWWAQLNGNLPRSTLSTDTGRRFLAVLDYPVAAGSAAK